MHSTSNTHVHIYHDRSGNCRDVIVQYLFAKLQKFAWRKSYSYFRVKKAYKCQCGKSYKTAQGLKCHSISQHFTSNNPPLPAVPPTPAPKPPGLVVTASPARSLNIVDSSDGNKLVRVYDSVKYKDLPTFTIPKHGISNLNIVTGHGQVVRHSGILTPITTPGCSPVDKLKFERSPRVTVQNNQPLPPLTPSYANDDVSNWSLICGT